MNAIILSLNNNLIINNDFQSDTHFFKINNLFNIERTILMLNDVGISDITIINNNYFAEYNYLQDKYSCTIIPISNTNDSLFHALYKIREKIKDTFIIDSNIVFFQNLFKYEPFSYCYITNNFSSRSFSYMPQIAQDNHIVGFEDSSENKDYFLEMIFLSEKDFSNYQNFFYSINTSSKINREYIFLNLIHNIHIYAQKIPYNVAGKIDTRNDYIQCLEVCQRYYFDFNNYFLNLYDYKNYFLFIQNEPLAIIYTQRLWKDYNAKHPDNPQYLDEPIIFSPNEFPFIIITNGIDIGFIDLIQECNYIRLKRMYIRKKYRNSGIGTQIIKKINTFCLLSGNELQVNVYDEAAARFYVRLGFKHNFTNYLLKGSSL